MFKKQVFTLKVLYNIGLRVNVKTFLQNILWRISIGKGMMALGKE